MSPWLHTTLPSHANVCNIARREIIRPLSRSRLTRLWRRRRGCAPETRLRYLPVKGGPDCADRKTEQCCHRRCRTRCRLIDLGVTRVHADLISTFDVQSNITPWFNPLATFSEKRGLRADLQGCRVSQLQMHWAQKAHSCVIDISMPAA